MRSAGGGQAEVRIQPRQALRLRAGRDRSDRDSRRLSTGLRGHGRQHLGQDDAAGFSGQDRGAIRQRQTHLGDGSRHPDRGGPGGDASLADADPLSRGHAARTADQAGKGACGQAVGRRARERAGQVDRTGAGDLRLRPQPSPAREGTGDAAASVAQADQTPARTARAEPDARRAVAEARRSQKGGRQGLRVADDPYADEGSAGHPANVRFRAGPQEASRRPAARRRLSASLQHQGRRPRPSLAALSPTGRDRASVQGTEERSVDSAHPSPARGPHRSPYLRGVPRLRPDGDAKTTAEGVGAGTDAPSRARKTRRHPDDRRRAAYDGRPHGRPGPPYRAGKRPPTPAATPEARPPRPAPTKNHGPAPPPGRLNPHSLCSADLWTRARAIQKASPRQTPPVGEVGLGWLVTDGYCAYRDHPRRQRCLAHLIRKGLAIAEGYFGAGSGFGRELVRDLRRLIERVHAGEGADTEAVKRLMRRIEWNCQCNRHEVENKVRELAGEILNDWDAVVAFVAAPNLPPTNNEAERALRHAVIARRISFGTRTDEGSRVYAAGLSVIATCPHRGVEAWAAPAALTAAPRAPLPAPQLPTRAAA